MRHEERAALGQSGAYVRDPALHDRLDREYRARDALIRELFDLDLELDADVGDAESFLARRAEVAAGLAAIYDPAEHGRRVLSWDGARLVEPEEAPKALVMLRRLQQSMQLEAMSLRVFCETVE